MSLEEFRDLPDHCYITRSQKLIPYVPEEKVKVLKYNKKLWSARFPDMGENIDYKKLQLTNIGEYSIAKPHISQALILFIKELLNTYNLSSDEQNITVTETNGGVGGFSIRLAQEFNNLNIVEINPTHADIIKNNLEVYGFGKEDKKNIKIWNSDYLNVINEIKSDVIICDPPWGGNDYIKQRYLSLGFNNVDISCVIKKLIQRDLFRIFVLMTPHNFDLNNFIKNISNDMVVRKMRAHYFIAIINTKRASQEEQQRAQLENIKEE